MNTTNVSVSASETRRSDKREAASTYRPLAPSPPPSVSISVSASYHDDAAHQRDPTVTSQDDEESSRATAGSSTKRQRFMGEYRVLEFGCTVVMLLVALLFSLIAVNQRPFPKIGMHLNATTTLWALAPEATETKLTQQVPMLALIIVGIVAPIAANLVVNYVLPKFRAVRVIPHDTRDFLLALLQSVAFTELVTQFIKNMTGRFRPCFYEMCGWNYDVVWDGVTNLCTDAAGEKEGRKSFPSGHSSFAWSTMVVLTLYLLGRSRLNCEDRSESMARGARKTLKLFLCCLPLLLATWVALTRSIDNWHHYSDILAGSVIGVVSALVAYSYNYGSVFSWESAGLPCEEIHDRRMQMQRDLKRSTRPPASLPNSDNSCEATTKRVSDRSEHTINITNRSRGPLSPAQ